MGIESLRKESEALKSGADAARENCRKPQGRLEPLDATIAAGHSRQLGLERQVADLQQEVVSLRGELKDASAEMVAAATPTSRPRSARTKVRSVSQPSLGMGEEARADNLGRNGHVEDDAAA